MAVVIRQLGILDYQGTWDEMRKFTQSRDHTTNDEIWVLEHHPVYTQGTSSRDVPSSAGKHIPVIHSDRGGKITYHGPGQLIVYLLFDIKRQNIGPRSLVNSIEQLIIDFLKSFRINASRKHGAPGVYVDDAKIAALGLRVSRGCCYHGLSINVNMDLAPFEWINPCGFEGLKVTQMKNHGANISVNRVRQELSRWLENL